MPPHWLINRNILFYFKTCINVTVHHGQCLFLSLNFCEDRFDFFYNPRLVSASEMTKISSECVFMLMICSVTFMV